MTGLSAEGLGKTYRVELPREDALSALRRFFSGRSPSRPFAALDGISFGLKPGSALALCGPNGSGKTTLLKILAGITAPSAGAVSFGGKAACLLGFGSILQDRLSVRENARLCAVFFGLFISGTELNISSMMGMTMIVGIVTEVAIFMVFEFFTAPEELDRNGALVYAGVHRMRAITMSTLAAILALLPLALGIGQGSAMQRPLAIAIVSGMAFQLPLVFFVLPVLFSVLGVERPKGQSGPTP